MKDKKAPEFPTQGAARDRLKKLAEFHKYLMESVIFPYVDYDHKTMALKKPGAEKIAFILKHVADYELLDIGGQFDVSVVTRRVKCKLFNSESRLVAVGLGECNTTEKKSTNAVLKIAKKRSYVDAVIAVACLSGVFTQDVEDRGPAYTAFENIPTSAEVEAEASAARSAAAPAEVLEAPTEDSGEAGPNIFTQTEDEPELIRCGVKLLDGTLCQGLANRYERCEQHQPKESPDYIPSRLKGQNTSRAITQRQANYFFAEAKDHGKSREEVTGAIASLGLKGTHEIGFQTFDDWLSWARGQMSLFDLSDKLKRVRGDP